MTRARKHLLRIATVFTGLAPVLAMAHPGHGEHASWPYVAGLLLAGTGLVAAGIAATRVVTRAITAAAPRSPT